MKLKNYSAAVISLSILAFTACSDNDDNLIQQNEYAVPTTYTFERNSASTVSYSGQSERIFMLEEMGGVFKTAAANGTTLSTDLLTNMYSNTNSPFTGNGLNASGKQLKNKTAASYEYFTLNAGGGTSIEQTQTREFFESTFSDGNLASQGNAAAAGAAGVYLDGSSKRLFAANGLEPQQVLLKGMMGASFLDQISNNYLSAKKLDEASNRENNTKKIFEEAKNYTTMEHYWDEAYGYVYGGDSNSGENKTYKFWSSYINQVNADQDFSTVKEKIEKAFIKGRAAIVGNDYETRNAQIKIIKENLALVPAVRAVYYLQEGKSKLVTDKGAKAFHALSEAYGFIMCLRYTNNPATNAPYFTKDEVDAMLETLTSGENGLWDIDTLTPKLDAVSAKIATKFDFTVAQAATVN
ncbi:DUF4856 domain-containing protein [Flavobacterium sp. TAB 87]|uniref:DUF4856 domain-containing protein n=1 Tax=Flavobacterium sp. TAB 87 TaxID=1729581 RepID=UPI00076CE120|nr:DUF4856 domain-containing protein [Flavobacterium sp. TAB 87]KVV13338.1 hypothetical protein AP058_02701 [Flavobacterium sp. TAB 87]